jgi:hypothetical protein
MPPVIPTSPDFINHYLLTTAHPFTSTSKFLPPPRNLLIACTHHGIFVCVCALIAWAH